MNICIFQPVSFQASFPEALDRSYIYMVLSHLLCSWSNGNSVCPAVWGRPRPHRSLCFLLLSDKVYWLSHPRNVYVLPGLWKPRTTLISSDRAVQHHSSSLDLIHIFPMYSPFDCEAEPPNPVFSGVLFLLASSSTMTVVKYREKTLVFWLWDKRRVPTGRKVHGKEHGRVGFLPEAARRDRYFRRAPYFENRCF